MLSPTGLPTTLIAHTSFAHRGRLYIIGGRISYGSGNGIVTRQVLSAGISSQVANGVESIALGDWRDAGSLPLPLCLHGTVLDAQNDRVYVINGLVATDSGNPTGGATTLQVSVGVINPSGSVSWTTSVAGPPLGTSEGDIFSVTMSGDYLFVGGSIQALGGVPPDYSGTVWAARVNRSTGAIGPWKNVSMIPPTVVAISGAPAGLLTGRIFACKGVLLSVGGVLYPASGPNVFAQIYWATINEDGTLGQWTALNFPDNAGRAGMFGAVIDDSVYVAGGWDDTYEYSQVFQIRINGGVPETPVLVGGLVVARDAAACAADGKILWISGGENYDTTVLSTIEAIKVK